MTFFLIRQLIAYTSLLNVFFASNLFVFGPWQVNWGNLNMRFDDYGKIT